MEKASKHISVLPEEVLEYLNVHSGGTYLDGTFGGGGHSKLILERSAPDGVVVGIDRDEAVRPWADDLTEQYRDRFTFCHLPYDQLETLGQQFDGVVFDLGLSSDQLEGSGRGFSFSRTEPLDMRFDPRGGQTAAQLLMQASPDRLERIFREYAEDRYAKALSRKIVDFRRKAPIRTTSDFIHLIGTSAPKVLAPLFQALRIEVNDELQTLKRGLQQANQVLLPGGRLVVITFHSLEDRLVKEWLRSEMSVITKKPISPSPEEIAANPRSRSAKLRAAVKHVEGHE